MNLSLNIIIHSFIHIENEIQSNKVNEVRHHTYENIQRQ